jgi:hypothetical protein
MSPGIAETRHFAKEHQPNSNDQYDRTENG